MRTIYLTLLALILTKLGFAQSLIIINDLTKKSLKGKIKSIRYYSIKNPTNYSKVSNYNNKGYLIEEIYFDYKNTELVKKRKIIKNYNYYLNNNIKTIETLDYYDLDNKTLDDRLVEKYNKQGELLTEINYETFYNRKKNRPNNPYKDISTKDSVVYNKKLNTKTTYRHHHSKGSLLHYWIEKYNNKGIIIEMKLYESNDSLSIENRYNKQGLEYMKIVYGNHKKDTLHKYVSKYNNLNNIIKYSKYETRNKEISIYDYKYKLDENKNWVIKNKFKEGIIIDSTKRDITYYQ